VSAGALAAGGVRSGYERAVAAHLFADHRISLRLGRVLAKDWGARGAVRVVGMNDWTRRNFARWMFEDEPRAVALTPARWHRKFFNRAGAFAAGHSGRGAEHRPDYGDSNAHATH